MHTRSKQALLCYCVPYIFNTDCQRSDEYKSVYPLSDFYIDSLISELVNPLRNQ